jgi:glycosyltransferase involved in cell wall biosynthesis
MGGAEHVVANLADELNSLGHKVKIAYLTGDILVSPKSSDIELISVGMISLKDFLKAYMKLRSIVEGFKPDIVHSHMFHSNILSRLLRLSIKIPNLITTVHSTNEGGKLRMLAYRLTDSLANISTNVSDEAVESYIHKKAVKSGGMISIANGIDTNKFYFNLNIREKKRDQLSISNKKMIFCVGRLDKPKDYPNLLSAIVLLKKSRQDFKVLIAGDGPLRNELNELLVSLDIKDYVSFIGIRRDIKELMSATDIYVMSSAWEGLPMVILEAMACERFIIATDCGGVRETIGSSGVIIEAGNSTQLSIQLNKALDLTDSERLEVGIAARQRIIDNYSLSSNIDAYLRLYNYNY